MKQEETYRLMEELFDQKLNNLKCDIKDIKKALYGNGKIGLVEQVHCNKDNIKGILGKLGMLSAFFGLVIAGMFEKITKFFTKRVGLE